MTTPRPFTARQLQVLHLLVEGHTNQAIALHLHIKPRTVGHHLEHIYHKLGASCRVQAVTAAFRQGLVK